MKTEEVKELISLGLTASPDRLKRSTWVKVQRVMEFLVKKNLVCQVQGNIRYKALDASVQSMTEAYCKSPFVEHLEELKEMSKRLHLPLNSGELLKEFTNLSI